MPTPQSPADADVQALPFEEAAPIPNHPTLPLLLYRGVLPQDPDRAEDLFARNEWVGAWRDGIFSYAHYHSNAHEVLGVVRGRATVRFGGDSGEDVEFAAGDVAVLPAGTGHQRLDASDDFLVVGAYPRGQENWDICRDAPDEAVRERIRSVSVPERDPVFGAEGPLVTHWR